MYARHYVAHTNDTAPLTRGYNRIVCGVPPAGGAADGAADARPRLLVPGRQALNDSACTLPPAQLPEALPHVIQDGSKAPARSQAGWNHGKRLGQTLVLAAPMAALRLPLVYAHTSPAVWPTDIVLRSNATGAVVASRRVYAPAASGSWTQLLPAQGAAFAPGAYELELTPVVADEGPMGLSSLDSFYYAPAWPTDVRVAVRRGGASVATYIQQPAVNATAAPGAGLGSADLATQLSRAAMYIVRRMLRQGSDAAAVTRTQPPSSQPPLRRPSPSRPLIRQQDLGIYIVPLAQYSGAPQRGINSGCSYYDLLRIGYKSSYFNLRMYEGLLAYAELEASGLVPPLPVEGGAQGAAAALGKDFVRQFVDGASGSVAAWVACTRADAHNSSLSGCNDAAVHRDDPDQLPVDYGFLPSQALAAQFGLDLPNGTVAKKWREMRDAARVQPGLFRLNLRGLETVSPRLIITSDDWALVDKDGFALRSWAQVWRGGRKAEREDGRGRRKRFDVWLSFHPLSSPFAPHSPVMSPPQTGDWQMFRCNASEPEGGCNGYGNWPLQGENGGVGLLGTSAFAYRAAPYAEMLADLSQFTAMMDSVFQQVDRNATSAPLLPQQRTALAVPVNDSLVRDLCVARRRSWPGINTTTDAWGKATLCDYYDSVTYPLPENGAVFWAWASGLLGLRVNVNGTLSLRGQAVPARLEQGHARGATDAGAWPSQVQAVSLTRLRAGGRLLNMTCTAGTGAGQASASLVDIACEWTSCAA